jgi:PhzF family phenazine biosynthesis protein
MLAVAAELGFSETAFLTARNSGVFDVRYFSPLAEVPFCGHATIAAAVAYAQRHGTGALTFITRAGTVEVTTASGSNGELRATLTSVAPRTVDLADSDLARLLDALGWGAADLDAALPPRVAFAGAWHPIIAAATRDRLADLDYDFDALATGQRSISSGGNLRPCSTHATPFRQAVSLRTQPPAPPRPPLAVTYAN